MYYVYVLKSRLRTYTYVGLTNNLERRIDQHQQGKSRTTRAYRPFELISVDKFDNRNDARDREKRLKSGFLREKRSNSARLPAGRQV
jgi:putative endonuclease